MKIKLMSYNIRLGVETSLAEVAEVIIAADPDFVALQEVGCHWIMGENLDMPRYLSQLTGLKYYDYVPTITEAGDAQYGIAVLSRHKLKHRKVTPLIQLIDEPRVVLETKIAIGEASVTLLSTHLSYLEKDCNLQIPELIALVEEQSNKTKLIVLGDLNFSTEDSGYQEFAGRMEDAHKTKAIPTFPTSSPKVKIDYIFYQNLSLLSSEVLPATASDHLAITGVFA